MSDHPSELAELPPSAKLVYKVLEYNGKLTQKAIAEKSMLSTRTVRYAISELEDIDAISEELYFPDARQRLYSLADRPDTTSSSIPSEA